ncbi:chloride channel CLIC-like protein 1 [Dendronephthya gigantea]|uniref:chloride channel CLIC-like protein 1 n=1 Tax=Dendronephthya gigantea TaxID=151771 RepID=UPI00106BAAE0|nr:chloride channel CLIC-like protein 1 [Dendronephthya gigantea]
MNMFECERLGFLNTFACFVFVICLCFAEEQASTADSDYAQSGHSSEHVEESNPNWVDPADLLSSDFSSFPVTDKRDVRKQESTTTLSLKNYDNHNINEQQNCELSYFKQLTRHIMERFQTPGKHYSIKIQLSKDDLKMLQEFKENDKKGERISDVFKLFLDIFNQKHEDEKIEHILFSRIWAFVEYHKDVFAVFFIIFALISILFIFETRTSMPWYQQGWYLFGLLFMISIPWEWFRLYRKQFAEKQADLIKHIPKHCAPEIMSIAERISLWMTGLFAWRDDDCIKYQEAILVDPVWEVSPSLALSITATRLFFKPLEYVADSCGRSLKAFFIHIPTVWQPIMVILMTIFLLLFILLMTKSRIKFAFFEIGPATTQAKRLERQEIDALKHCIRQEICDVLKRKVDVFDRKDRLNNLEESPRLSSSVEEERVDHRKITGGVQEYDIPHT